MEFTAKQIADILHGKVIGDENIVVNKLSKIEEGEPHSLSFLSNLAYKEFIYTTQSSIVIVDHHLKLEKPIQKNTTLIEVEDARNSFAKLLQAFHSNKHSKTGINPNAHIEKNSILNKDTFIDFGCYISENVIIDENTKIYAHCYIGANVKIGKNCIIHPGVKILDDCVIGNNCTIHAGVVIGSDGFGFAPNSAHHYEKVVHIGNVVIEDYVEIGANTTIDRATMGSTFIRKGVKLDNLIQIAHNVDIGENTVIAAQTGVAGSTKIGKNCMIGGQVGIVGHLIIADGVKIAAQSGIGNSITTENEIVQGSPAFAISDYKKAYVIFRKLPFLAKKIDLILKELTTTR
jgi:UDP-3-O-[3-hydroxymyristoyl] glucosamine N-acyltransferase